jgi:hypothetical protein
MAASCMKLLLLLLLLSPASEAERMLGVSTRFVSK